MPSLFDGEHAAVHSNTMLSSINKKQQQYCGEDCLLLLNMPFKMLLL